MFGFKIEIMVICIRSKPDLFYFGDLRLCLHLLFLLLLIVKEFIIIYDLANRWIHLRRYFYQVKSLFHCHFQCILGTVDPYFHIFTNQPHLRHPDKMIDAMLCFFPGYKPTPVSSFVKTTTAWFFETSARWPVKSAFLWYCHLVFLVNNHFYIHSET